MVGLLDVVFVTLIAVGAAVLVGILGYLIDKTGAADK
jgi:hypothetical protein